MTEQAVGQLKGTKADRAEKKKVLRALQRVQLQQEKDEAKVAAFAHAAAQQVRGYLVAEMANLEKFT
eukprot:1156908-Pelagomonas_calceolata.AAC.1